MPDLSDLPFFDSKEDDTVRISLSIFSKSYQLKTPPRLIGLTQVVSG